MITITRQPRLLVKMAPGASQLNLGISSSPLVVQPLFRSIKPPTKTGITKSAEWHIVNAQAEADEVNVWDLCHQMMNGDFGVAGPASVEFAEPDIEQRWVSGTETDHAMAAVAGCDKPEDPDSRPPIPMGDGFYWFRDAKHSELELARTDVGAPANRVRIAHLDTGYDRDHITKPQFLRTDLQKNFVDDNATDDATDTTGDGAFNNFGHGTGTLGILAGAAFDGSALGGAAFLDVVPIRVANSVVLFKNSSIARAFDYVHSLANKPSSRVHVITMSMGGLASQAWADAVNALYELGVFIVTAAGNNFGNFPTRHIVYPARFKRVIAACGVMADDRPYADLPLRIMAGNYGPDSKMETAFSAYTPNTPWARLGCSQLVDHNGAGTSSATPQIAAAAALWIQKNRAHWDSYSQGWMRVEGVRQALKKSARLPLPELKSKLGLGIIQAQKALVEKPNESELTKTPADSASFPFLRVITGLGIVASDSRQRMLEIEALQLIQQSKELEELFPDPQEEVKTLDGAERKNLIDALASAPGASRHLREALGSTARTIRPQVSVPKQLTPAEATILKRAMEPEPRDPQTRSLRVFAFDPLAAAKLETVAINETTIPVRWEKLTPGPVGEYLEVVDIDPATGVCYAPINLDQPFPLSQAGYRPSEANAQFHQQMVYAVAMKTIEHFEKALGRVALWAPRILKINGRYESHYIPRLRIYPHALREKNAYYSPDKIALLFGYFRASESQAGENIPGQTIFCCLSHDIVAHETTHALLDGLHRRFREPTNADVLGFHEAFADIVALFQHFTVPEALRDQIARTQGDLAKQSLLGELAQQFGQGVGRSRALRTAIGGYSDETGEWESKEPTPADYANASEAHDRGAVLVAAVFEAFLNIYRRRSEDLIRLATGGTGILPAGNIPHDLVNRLAKEASKTASHVLNMCIRALDYSPPMDMNFGDYLRAFITADRDLVKDDDLRYRVAFLEAFRRRGIYPSGVRNLSTESVCWNTPELEINIEEGLNLMSLTWDLRTNRKAVYDSSGTNARTLHGWLKDTIKEDQARSLGFSLTQEATFTVENEVGKLSKFEVHSVRPVRRVGPDGQQQLDLVVEITQNWISESGTKYRGGSTLIIDLEKKKIRYVVRKTVANAARIEKQRGFRLSMADTTLRSNYFDEITLSREPFAMLHRGA